ncbi:hypothetical protein AnigIFM60653_011336 [Aspergillus niger]|nr:hypothetical protein AnigIFM60653_011336 [Aspergillus niger]
MQDLVAPDDEFLMYVDDTAETRRQVLTDMDNFLAMETEPFDGLLAFSLGAGCGASYLIHKMQQGTPTNRLPFRFAVFFCGAPALFGRPIRETVAAPSMDAEIIGIDKAREGDSGKPSEVIEIPTAHIWGRNGAKVRIEKSLCMMVDMRSQGHATLSRWPGAFRQSSERSQGREVTSKQASKQYMSMYLVMEGTV